MKNAYPHPFKSCFCLTYRETFITRVRATVDIFADTLAEAQKKANAFIQNMNADSTIQYEQVRITGPIGRIPTQLK